VFSLKHVFAIRDDRSILNTSYSLDGIDINYGFETLHYQHLIYLRTRYFPDAHPILSENEKEPQIQNERSSSESAGLDARGSPQKDIRKLCLESSHLIQQTLY